MDDQYREQLLNDVDAGRIDVAEAIRRLEEDPEAAGAGSHEPREAESMPARWRQWWWIPFSVGVAIAAAGYGLSTIGGWWWVCAGPLLFVGILLMAIMLASSNSPWVHIRVHTAEDEWPRRIAISVPLPIRPTAWMLRVFGPSIRGFDSTGLDELLIAMGDTLDQKTPISIFVDEAENGERVEVVMG